MPHPRVKVHTQMPLPWDVLDRQMPRCGGGGMGTLGFDSCIKCLRRSIVFDNAIKQNVIIVRL